MDELIQRDVEGECSLQDKPQSGLCLACDLFLMAPLALPGPDDVLHEGRSHLMVLPDPGSQSSASFWDPTS